MEMESSSSISARSKRQRLILVSPPASLQRSDLSATFDSMNDDTLTTVLEFVGDKCYRSFGGTNKNCKDVYLSSGMTKETYLYGYAPLSVIRERYDNSFSARDALSKGVVLYNRIGIFEWALREKDIFLLRGICYVSAEEGRVDLLNKVWNNVRDDEDDKDEIFYYVECSTARDGKLEVLKWFEIKGLFINKFACAKEAAIHGQLHIMKWLREKQGLKLNGYLYDEAIDGDHFHVLKWLREQSCPWKEYTFHYAAQKGNMEIIQFLHDEGCPWNRSFLVREDRLKPEVIDWCEANGYMNRIVLEFDSDDY